MALAEVEALLGGPATETIDWQAEGAPVEHYGYRRQRAPSWTRSASQTGR
jgi:hypothetical protein